MLFSLNSKFSLKNALGAYHPVSLEEQDFKQKMLHLLDRHGESCFHRTLSLAHFTASAWVVDRKAEKALLTHHKKLNKWLQVGGHADGDQHLLRVAAKELREESGLTNFQCNHHQIFDIDIHTIPAQKNEATHEHFDVRFLFEADANENLAPNHESIAMKWVDWADIEKTLENASIQRMNKKVLGIYTTLATENK